ncbi:MAG: hypothetical protein NUV64_03220 [Parcubacteria group bacterium]|nr:hypothetical protein [Parcubacteria group bacterium]MCR4342420.1 hypothetical protein [Patescibacteria group bacterium]
MKKIILVLVLLVAFLLSFALEKSHAYVEIEDGVLVAYEKRILSSGVPDGIPAEESLKLFNGEIALYTVKGDRNYTYWDFGFPVDTRYTRTDRIISYGKKDGWGEKSTEIDIKEKSMYKFILMFAMSFIGILLISLIEQGEGNKKDLFLCYGAIFVSVVFTIAVGLTIGKYSTTAGYVIGLIVIGLAGTIFGQKLHWRYGWWGGIFFSWGNADMGSYAHLSTDKALLVYVFFIISIGAISYLTANILNHAFSKTRTVEEKK